MHEYGETTAKCFNVIYADGTKKSFTELGVPQLSNTPVVIDISNCIAIDAENTIPPGGQTAFFTYVLSKWTLALLENQYTVYKNTGTDDTFPMSYITGGTIIKNQTITIPPATYYTVTNFNGNIKNFTSMTIRGTAETSAFGAIIAHDGTPKGIRVSILTTSLTFDITDYDYIFFTTYYGGVNLTLYISFSW